MERVRISDIAEELGLSTATVSNVIHGKTGKVSPETVRRVQETLEKRRYIPSMAGILLAQNDSRIIGVVMNDHEKYQGHLLEDPFIAASLAISISGTVIPFIATIISRASLTAGTVSVRPGRLFGIITVSRL